MTSSPLELSGSRPVAALHLLETNVALHHIPREHELKAPRHVAGLKFGFLFVESHGDHRCNTPTRMYPRDRYCLSICRVGGRVQPVQRACTPGLTHSSGVGWINVITFTATESAVCNSSCAPTSPTSKLLLGCFPNRDSDAFGNPKLRAVLQNMKNSSPSVQCTSSVARKGLHGKRNKNTHCCLMRLRRIL